MKKQKVEFATRKVENDSRKQRWDCQKSSIFHLSTPSSTTQQANHQGRELYSAPLPPEPPILYPRDETRDSVQEILPESAVGSLTFNIPMNNDANEWFHISINPEVTLYCRVSVYCQIVLSYIMRHFSAPIL